jgi:hypothetical protein
MTAITKGTVERIDGQVLLSVFYSCFDMFSNYTIKKNQFCCIHTTVEKKKEKKTPKVEKSFTLKAMMACEYPVEFSTPRCQGLLTSIFSGPVPGSGFITCTVGLVNMGEFRYKWVYTQNGRRMSHR